MLESHAVLIEQNVRLRQRLEAANDRALDLLLEKERVRDVLARLVYRIEAGWTHHDLEADATYHEARVLTFPSPRSVETR